MWKKLLKYDFRSLRRFGLPILVIIAAAGLLGAGGIVGLILSLRANLQLAPLLSTVFMLLLSLVFMVIGLGVAGIGVAILVDYYKTLATDEAYLTFTLPVRPREILWSKLLNCCIWSTIVTLASFFVGGIMLLVGLGAGGVLPEALAGFREMLAALFHDAPLPVYSIGLLGVILFVTYAVNNQLLVFMAIFLGSVIAKKNKLLWSIGSVIVVNMIYSTVTSLVQTLCLIPMITADATGGNVLVALHITLISYILLLTALSVLFFKLTEKMMEKRLNLA